MNETLYQPVPVSVARQIAEKCCKDIVVIFSIDRTHDKSHFTSYGVSSVDKMEAAQFADEIAAGLGCGQPRESFEDFRTVPAAESARKVDVLSKAGRAVDHALSSLLACRVGIPDEFLKALQETLRAALVEASTPAGLERGK